MEIKETEKLKKNLHRFVCEKCDFTCYMKCDWERHIMRAKHLKFVNGNDMETKKLKKTYFCDCGKKFLSNSGLWKHKKVCNYCEETTIKLNTPSDTNYNTNTNTNTNANAKISDDNLVVMLINQCKELRDENKELIEIIKNGTYNTTNNTNSHNKTFNLQFFLHETCKDAMNIMDFVDSIKLQLTDLEKVGNIGYVEGISNIITNNLKALDVTQRPIHCTDNKREVLYVKDEDKWEKENDEKKKLRKAIKHIAHKNSKLISDFKNKYPDCVKSDSKKSDQYNKLIIEAMGGPGDNDMAKEDKIIKRIAKEVTIDK
jgi:hypothetical protein